MNLDLLQPNALSATASAPLPARARARAAQPSSRALGMSVARSWAGIAAFGLATATAHSTAPSLQMVLWSALLPALLACTWLVCLPALYIPWAGREEDVTLGGVIRSAAVAFTSAGACLASTSPIVLFFAATAPESNVSDGLAFIFFAFAMIAQGTRFGREVREQALDLPGWALLLFFGLFTVTFFQFSGVAGLRWF